MKTILEHVGKEDYEKLTDMMVDNVADKRGAQSKKLEYGGPTTWSRYIGNHFRAEFREEGDDFVFNFYHLNGPDPLKGFNDPDANRVNEKGHTVAAVEYGTGEELPSSFWPMLRKVIDLIFQGLPYTMDYIKEMQSGQLRVVGAARKALAKKRFTQGFLDCVDVNIPEHCPSLTIPR